MPGGLNRRIKKVDKDSEPDVEYSYYYNTSWQVVEVRRTPAGDSESVYKQYVWDLRYIDAPVLRWWDANGDGDFADENETLYYTNDANMNVTALVNTSGDVVERYSYDPYGRVTVRNGENGVDPDVDGTSVFEWDADADGASDVDNVILYAGYLYDDETGLFHVRHRTYHPTLGRWLQRDPLAYVDGMSLYEYCRSGPIVGLDPSGLILPGGWSSWGDGEWEMYWRQATPGECRDHLHTLALGAKVLGMPKAAKMMRHFLQKKGGSVSLPWDWLMKSKSAKKAADLARKRARYVAIRFVGEILDLNKLSPSNRVYEADSFQEGSGLAYTWQAKRKKDNRDVWYAMGRFTVEDHPWLRATYTRGHCCTVTVKLKHRFRVEDDYDWHDQKHVRIPITVPNPLGHGPTKGTMYVPDWVPNKVLNAGLASTFVMKVEHDEEEEFTKDEAYFIREYRKPHNFARWESEQDAEQTKEEDGGGDGR